MTTNIPRETWGQTRSRLSSSSEPWREKERDNANVALLRIYTHTHKRTISYIHESSSLYKSYTVFFRDVSFLFSDHLAGSCRGYMRPFFNFHGFSATPTQRPYTNAHTNAPAPSPSFSFPSLNFCRFYFSCLVSVVLQKAKGGDEGVA